MGSTPTAPTMKRKTFKDLVAEVPKPKPLKAADKLPYVFDLHYDCKTLRDVVMHGYWCNPDTQRLLIEHGYDLSVFRIFEKKYGTDIHRPFWGDSYTYCDELLFRMR